DVDSDASGFLYVTNFGDGTVRKFDSNGAAQPIFASGLSLPVSIRFDSSGNLYISTDSGTIQRFDSSGTDLGTFANVGDNTNLGIEFDLDGNVYLANISTDAIVKIDANGAGTTFASFVTSNLSEPYFIARQLISPTAATIQFSTPSYSANETSGSVTLTVTRTGDTSGSA